MKDELKDKQNMNIYEFAIFSPVISAILNIYLIITKKEEQKGQVKATA